MQPEGKEATKALARKMKSLLERIQNVTQRLSSVKKAKPSGSMKPKNKEEKKDRHVHFKADVQINEISANTEVTSNGNLAAKRTWNDSKKREIPLDRGQF